MEHLQIVAFPLDTFRPQNFIKRKIKVNFKSGAEWRAWLRNIQEDDIEWRPPHWDLGDMTWSVERKNEVLLIGMDAIIAYYPCYIRRQYKLAVIIPATITTQPLPIMNEKFLGAYRNNWARRMKKGPKPAFSVYLPDGYVEYMQIEASKARKRIDEKEEDRKKQKKC